MNTRQKERIIGRDGDNLIIEQYVETEYHYVCPNCPGSPGMIAINGIKAEALQALWRAAKSQGLGLLEGWMKLNLTVADCRELLASQTYFDYLHGHVMKVDFSGDEFDPRLYDRDNGPRAAERAIGEIRMYPLPDRDYHFKVWGTEPPGPLTCMRCGR